MAKFTVDTSRIQPKGGIVVTKANTKSPAFSDMPTARGSRTDRMPEPAPPAAPKLKVANLPAGTPDLPSMPTPPSSVFVQPPAKVVAARPQPPLE